MAGGDVPVGLVDAIRDTQPAARRTPWASVVTSVDVKLAYARERDRFEAFVIGDVNANPEGITTVHADADRDVVDTALAAYRSVLPDEDGAVAATVPPSVYDPDRGTWRNEGDWITRDKQALVDALRAASDRPVHVTADGHGLSARDGALRYDDPDGDPVACAGYVNLDDTGEWGRRLFADAPGALAAGANAPTATWTASLPDTGKDALLGIATTLAADVPGVTVPRFDRVTTLADVDRFRRTVDGPVVVKGPFGTHGDEVVPVHPDDDVAARVDEQAAYVRDLRDWPAFALRDGDRFRFANFHDTPVAYAVVERAVTGTFTRDDTTYDVVARAGDDATTPVDFVPLVTRTPDAAAPMAVPSILVRASGTDSLNGNLGARWSALEHLDRAYDAPVAFDTPDGARTFALRDRLETLADRTVSLAELRAVLERAGYVALATRNRAAHRAERAL